MMPQDDDGRAVAQHVQTEAGVASAEDGHVVLDGPDGVAVTMTAQAAAETGERLIRAAAEAAQQQRDPA